METNPPPEMEKNDFAPGESPNAPTSTKEFTQKKWFKLLIIPLGILIVFGLLSQGRHLVKNRQAIPTPTQTLVPSSTLAPTSTPLPPEFLEQIKTVDGNIVQITTSGEIKTLVNKDDFQSQSISAFSEVKISPDQSKMCFLGHSPGSIILYFADTNGSKVTKIDTAKNCVWSNDSQKIAYNNYTTDVSPVDVYVFFILTGETKNLTKDKAEKDQTRFYELPRWSPDDQKIISKFVTVKLPKERTRATGFSEINLSTGEVIDQMLTEEVIGF